MTQSAKYLLAIAPVITISCAWLLATWAFDYFNCAGNIKYMRDCFAGSANLQPYIGIGIFWGPILLLFAVPTSFALVVTAYITGRKGKRLSAA